MGFCAKCGAQLADGVTFCGGCGSPVGASAGSAPASAAPSGSSQASSGLDPKVAGAVAYFTIIPAIIFLVVEPYNRDKFVRFHAFQCLFLAVSAFVLFFVVGIFAVIPFIGWIVGAVCIPLLALSMFVLILFLMFKAYNGEKFMLPVIGKFAEEQAAK